MHRIYFTRGIAYRKACARWASHSITSDQKHMLMKVSEESLEYFNKNKTDFVHWFIMINETCIHHYTPESRHQSKRWTEAGSAVSKKAKLISSSGKVISSQCRPQNLLPQYLWLTCEYPCQFPNRFYTKDGLQ